MTAAIGAYRDPLPTRELEDVKVALDLALWIILFLGDMDIISSFNMGATMACLSVARVAIDLSKQGENFKSKTTADKIEKYSPQLEFGAGMILACLVMGDVVSADNSLWAFYANQLLILGLNQVAKRVGEKTLGKDEEDERYDCQKDLSSQSRKLLEDTKFVLENVALWIILYLGDNGNISEIAMGASAISILSLRVFIDMTLLKKSPTTLKVAALFEFFAGVILCSLVLGNVISPDDMLWSFFGVQLLAMLALQIAKRVSGGPESYLTFDKAQTQL